MSGDSPIEHFDANDASNRVQLIDLANVLAAVIVDGEGTTEVINCLDSQTFIDWLRRLADHAQRRFDAGEQI